MIDLTIQIKSLIFSFFYGILFSLLLNINYSIIHHKFLIYRVIVNILFVFDNVLLYFIILRVINNGIVHYYFIIMIFLGFIISYVKWKKIRLKLIINNAIIGNTRSDIVSKKITKKDKRRISLIFGFMILVMAIIIFNISKIWLKILEKNKEYHFLENELVRLNKEEKNLKNELVKLQNPDYVARYAREKYLYSRDGEITIKIP